MVLGHDLGADNRQLSWVSGDARWGASLDHRGALLLRLMQGNARTL